ncbi:MAG: MvaI/BcnI family restriction endonuclease [Kiritimatiellia bacterium]|jgi:hypothetical protein
MQRPLTKHEKSNLTIIRKCTTDIAFLYITPTGLQKAILDAVLPVRTLLKVAGVHDYGLQSQGPTNKVVTKAQFISGSTVQKVSASMYRPVTKKGDPRIWFSRLSDLAKPNDVLGIFVHHEQLYAVNLTKTNLATDLDAGRITEALERLNSLRDEAMTVSSELLNKLRRIVVNGPLPAICKGSTAIGRTIESALGLAINSSKEPDYKGIEIKSAREASLHATRLNRVTLFAQVPDWSISRYKSSRELLDTFGYDRNGVRKLYCTVAIGRPNSQGLLLAMLKDAGQLKELHNGTGQSDVVAWQLDNLHARLLEKHRETFWINASACHRDGKEFFVLKSVRHTRGPSSAQFDELLEEGHITVDHLIKRKDGRVSEKGPLFKLPKQRIPALFLAESLTYTL